MRVRPFFWFLLALSCLSVLTFAATRIEYAPVIIQVHIDQPKPTAYTPSTLTLHLSDPQGLPIEQADVASYANMTDMDMGNTQSKIMHLGNGTYKAQLYFSMRGPWAITIVVHVDGFAPLRQTLNLQVV